MYFSECPPTSELVIPNVRCCPTAPELLRTIFRDVRSHPVELKRCPSDPGRISPNVRLRNTPLDVSPQQHPMHTAASLWDKRVLWQRHEPRSHDSVSRAESVQQTTLWNKEVGPQVWEVELVQVVRENDQLDAELPRASALTRICLVVMLVQ